MTNYYEIVTILKKFFMENIDKQIGELTFNDITTLADAIDNNIEEKISFKSKVKKLSKEL